MLAEGRLVSTIVRPPELMVNVKLFVVVCWKEVNKPLETTRIVKLNEPD